MNDFEAAQVRLRVLELTIRTRHPEEVEVDLPQIDRICVWAMTGHIKQPPEPSPAPTPDQEHHDA